MKKQKIAHFLRIIGCLLVVGFTVRLGVDYVKLYPFGSAPFDLYIIERSIEFVIPAVLCFIVSVFFKRKYPTTKD